MTETTQDAHIEREQRDADEISAHPRGHRLSVHPLNARNLGKDYGPEDFPESSVRVTTPRGICPKCGNDDIAHAHRDGDALAPECDYKMCPECWHEWDHV